MLDKAMRCAGFISGYPARHPMIWLLVPAVVFMGATAGAGEPPVALWAALAALTYPFSFIMFALNDLYDGETDAYNDRDVVKDDAVDPEEDAGVVWSLSAVFAVLVVAPAAWFGEAETVLLSVVMLGAAVAYSVPPLRLKARPVSSLAAMSIGGWALYAYGFSFTDSLANIPPRSYYYGALSHMAVSLGALPDVDADRRAGDRTFPVVFGETATILLAVATVAATILFSGITGPVLWFLYLTLAVLVSMLVTGRYIMHLWVAIPAGYCILAYLLYRGWHVFF